ncbi:hypothetical protein CHS0354_032275 [Potamilus streckersoni]|uniref:Uncharacterized protein n=1 Tax=Potamilus streckersoni TaxID=2493646 RepID=A0AAE0VH39_9BIVA|nr:hypothetical protein CHS0354_032275 [Potamilus streckersoni]
MGNHCNLFNFPLSAPFACSGGIAATALLCMQTPSIVSPTALEAIVTSGANVGNVDATSNLLHDKVYIFDGQFDSVVNPGIGPKIQQFYGHFISDTGHIKTVFDIQAEHGQPTDNFGGPCNKLSHTDFMLNCNYSAAFDLLNFIYGGHLKRPNAHTSPAGKLLKFNQEVFFYVSTPSMYSMDDIGFIYVPSRCLDKSRSCKLHIAFHGCLMGQRYIGENYVSHAGYNEVGELNNIIILYPQVIKSLTNPQGCWDWWGYTGILFATKSGFQITAVERMLSKVLGL